jgi:hypothetical protein
MADQPLPAPAKLTLYRGDTRVWEDTFRHAPVPPATVGDPVDLTGYEWLAQIRATEDTAEVMATIDVEIVDAEAGTIRRTLTAAEADKLVPGTAHWDLQAIHPDGVVRTYMAGRVRVLGDVSRP